MSANLVVIANDNNPVKRQLLENIHASSFTNQLGYLDGMDPDTGEIVPLLVGIDRDDEGNMSLFPIAKLFLSSAELKTYLAPDQYGNFIQSGVRDAIDDACRKAKE